ncbi:lysozyme-like domain-containing protein [Jimgerdemannia flammicorona]|uniref:Lysozyme-like domain-containing protein n=1 Tax=Jimgerdemannia flammicorona TaxID=994334 RepID=A0A433QC61_9FUNG|nr:lysozyme-like domain-containing protein [Jimgerdemannia flammicorona]
MKSFTLLAVLGLVGYASAGYPFCKGQFASTTQHCTKFQFTKRAPPCVNTANCTTFYDISGLPDQGIDDHTAKMAQLITNVFENGNTVMGYAYVENLKDNRGLTKPPRDQTTFRCFAIVISHKVFSSPPLLSGYIGFTSGTNDAYTVVQEYNKRTNNKNNLYKFTPELARLSKLPFCDVKRGSVTKLGQPYFKAWEKSACTDPRFVETQIDVGRSMYLHPALKFAASVGVKSNIGKAFFYDTIIQHGWQFVEPLINIRRIIKLTGPRGKDSEQAYLIRFLNTRRSLMCCFPDNVWPPSADRVSDLTNLINSPAKWARNKDLKNPVNLAVYGVTVKGTENMNYDSSNCKKYKKSRGWSLPKGKSLPIPGSTKTCPK